jgi:hypothetical protein
MHSSGSIERGLIGSYHSFKTGSSPKELVEPFHSPDEKKKFPTFSVLRPARKEAEINPAHSPLLRIAA